MRSDAVVIISIRFQNPAQMRLAQDNDVVHTLTADRSDQPFGKAILPRRGWCGRLVPDAHGAQSACDDAAIDPVAIADQVARGLIPRKCLRDLTCNPFRRRICCDVDPDEVSAVEPDDDEGIEQVETDSWNNEQVHGGDVWRVEEGPPSLAGRPPPIDHVVPVGKPPSVSTSLSRLLGLDATCKFFREKAEYQREGTDDHQPM